MIGFNLLAALMALYMLVRHARAAAGILRPGADRARAVVPLLTCLAALAVLVMAARGLFPAAPRSPGGLP